MDIKTKTFGILCPGALGCMVGYSVLDHPALATTPRHDLVSKIGSVVFAMLASPTR